MASPVPAGAVRFKYTGTPCAVARVLFRSQRAYFASFSHAKKIVAAGRVWVRGVVGKGNTEVREGDEVAFVPSHEVVHVAGAAERWVHAGEAAELREVLAPYLSTAASVKKALEGKHVTVDGVAAGDARALIAPGAELAYESGTARRVVYFDELEVVYEAASWAVVVKPPGLFMDASAGSQEGGREGAKSKRSVKTLASVLPHNLQAAAAPDRLAVPAAVHRLDAPVGGLVAVAKTRAAARALAGAFAARDVAKTYTAIVAGRPDGADGEITADVDGKPAKTTYHTARVIQSLRFGHVSVLELHPHTGRFHQLRRHLAWALKTPIIGDKAYAPEHEAAVGSGMYLWASRLEVPDPGTGERRVFTSAPPAKYESFLRREERVSAAAASGEVTSDYVRRLIQAKAEDQQDPAPAPAKRKLDAEPAPAAKRARARADPLSAAHTGCPVLASWEFWTGYIAHAWDAFCRRVLVAFGTPSATVEPPP
eukprot:TRINITY_DN7468_c0_g4_i1.p1 TRINITY_DN7468_c0_g4~~TRINITY_DN7468_c0_g4_i1.p1  ORF type:complete len:482 (+),score=122.83 TRINITY_DN7468_c0_g4_i1:1312-2757(+)